MKSIKLLYFTKLIILTKDDQVLKYCLFLTDFKVSVLLDYDNEVLGTQYAEIRNMDDYPTEIANCKTFVLLTVN